MNNENYADLDRYDFDVDEFADIDDELFVYMGDE